jgi:hypothetical protein
MEEKRNGRRVGECDTTMPEAVKRRTWIKMPDPILSFRESHPGMK